MPIDETQFIKSTFCLLWHHLSIEPQNCECGEYGGERYVFQDQPGTEEEI